jgi:hypothetical protein
MIDVVSTTPPNQEVQTPKTPQQIREARLDNRITALDGRVASVIQAMRDQEERLGAVVQANQGEVMKTFSVLLTNVHDTAQMSFAVLEVVKKLREEVAELRDQNHTILAAIARLHEIIADGAWQEAEVVTVSEDDEPDSETIHQEKVQRALNETIFTAKAPFTESNILFFDSLSLQVMLAEICTDFEGEVFSAIKVQSHFNRVTSKYGLPKFSPRAISYALTRYATISERLGFTLTRVGDQANVRFAIARV